MIAVLWRVGLADPTEETTMKTPEKARTLRFGAARKLTRSVDSGPRAEQNTSRKYLIAGDE